MSSNSANTELNSTTDTTFNLVSSDGDLFPITTAAAWQSRVLRDAFLCGIEPTSDLEAPVSVGSKTLPNIIEWMEHHKNDEINDEDEDNAWRLPAGFRAAEWDQKFLEVDQSTLFEYVLAANFLEIHLFYHLLCKAIADLIKGKTTEEMRKIFAIENDWPEGEEERIREENAWADNKIFETEDN
jgi:S-phase kinase-associated protein 1